MAKIGIFSDLHCEFRDWNYDFREGVIYINAGDTGTVYGGMSSHIRGRLKKDIEAAGSVYLDVAGNHDFYGGEFPLPGEGQFIHENIAGATLWTHLNPVEFVEYKYSLSDGECIKRLTYESYIEAHLSDVEFLRQSKAEIIVTHHSPTNLSIAAQYKGDPMNKFFHNRVGDFIEELKPKLWIHGHTHIPCMYWVDKTLVVCHPRGYPNENPKEYSPFYVDI